MLVLLQENPEATPRGDSGSVISSGMRLAVILVRAPRCLLAAIVVGDHFITVFRYYVNSVRTGARECACAQRPGLPQACRSG
jgi:hypothetical protein